MLVATTAVASRASATELTVAATTHTRASAGASLAIRVSGGALVDSTGKTVQLRGVNVSGLEFTAVQGWDAGDPWGGMDPNWSAIKSWGVNAVRLPLNEASWLGLKCAEDPGNLTTLVKADPGGNYRATVEKAVSAANAVGLRVIIDLHWSAPNRNGVPLCPMTQNVMASADHAPAFWTSVATTFKANPSVLFELFNEPFMGEWNTTGGTSAAARIRNGGTATGFLWGYGDSSGVWHGGTYATTWKTAGMQQLLTAVRATKATNVVLVGSDSWDQQIVDSVANLPTDSLSPAQVAIAWHPYATYSYGTPQVLCVNLPSCSSLAMSAAAAAVKAGHPVVATEFGDNITSTPSTSSPWAQILLPYLDSVKISYLGWTWDPWGDTANVLIRDSAGTPTYGYGQYVQAHLLCRAAATC